MNSRMQPGPRGSPSTASEHSTGLGAQIKLEIERKFLVLALPPVDFASLSPVSVRQGYLPDHADGSEERVREIGGVYVRTIKSTGDIARPEQEWPISTAEFESLWLQTEGRRIFKTRYRIALGENTIDFDLFDKNLAGLMLAEVEFPNLRAAELFTAPSWFAKEVTADKRYKNRNLALNGRPE